VKVVDPDGGALPGEPGDRGHLVARLERGRGHGDHRERRDAQERGQEPVGVVVPGGGPGDVEDVQELADPYSVRRAQADWFFSGEQVVFGEPVGACRGAVGVEDSVDVEQQGGARHRSSMDAACRGEGRSARGFHHGVADREHEGVAAGAPTPARQHQAERQQDPRRAQDRYQQGEWLSRRGAAARRVIPLLRRGFVIRPEEKAALANECAELTPGKLDANGHLEDAYLVF